MSKEGCCYRSTLGSQTPLPNLTSLTALEWEKASTLPAVRVMYAQMMEESSRGLVIKTELLGRKGESNASSADLSTNTFSRICLYKLNMSADDSLEAHIVYKGGETNPQVETGLYCAYKSPLSDEMEYCQSPIQVCIDGQAEMAIAIKSKIPGARLVELGCYLSGPLEIFQPITLCQLLNVIIKAKQHPKMEKNERIITNLRVIERGPTEKLQRRLTWDLAEPSGGGPSPSTGLPCSNATGPFSHFTVSTKNHELGKAYCMEFCLWESDFREANHATQEFEVEMIVRGILFGGGAVESAPTKIASDWTIL